MFINILQNSSSATFSKRHRCFPENFQIFLRTPFSEDLNGVAEWCDWLFRHLRLNDAVANNSYTARIHQQTFWIDSRLSLKNMFPQKMCWSMTWSSSIPPNSYQWYVKHSQFIQELVSPELFKLYHFVMNTRQFDQMKFSPEKMTLEKGKWIQHLSTNHTGQ